jgi:hypothetical protein
MKYKEYKSKLATQLLNASLEIAEYGRSHQRPTALLQESTHQDFHKLKIH